MLARQWNGDVVDLTCPPPPAPASGAPHVTLIDHSLRGPAQARSAVARCVAGLCASADTDDLLLVVSELVTNAVRHGAPPVRLEVSVGDHAVLVCVADGSPRSPEARDADAEAEGGRGMTLVDLLSSAHGVRSVPPGKAVWASMPRPPASEGTP